MRSYKLRMEFYRQKLQDELSARCDRNPRYSLRAFAQALDLNAGTLSRIFSGKQVPSPKLAQKLAASLDLDSQESENFFRSLTEKQSNRLRQRAAAAYPQPKPQDLSLKHLRVIADWYHVAILELTYVRGIDLQPRAIAKALGISTTEAKLALERLLELGLLREEGKRLVKTSAQLSSADKQLTNAALRRHQRELLEKAIHSLENDPIEARSVTAMTMAIDERKLPEAKKMISDFNRQLCAFLECGERRTVYNLGVALYPLQKRTSGDKK